MRQRACEVVAHLRSRDALVGGHEDRVVAARLLEEVLRCLALVLGEDEVSRGVVAIKALRRESAQEECNLQQINERIGILLGLKGGSGK